MKKTKILNRKSKIGGSVLILVLWALFALATLTVAVGAHVSATMSLSERLWRITESRALAEAGAHQALMAAASYANSSNSWDGVAEDSWNRDKELFFECEVGWGSCSVHYLTVTDSGTIVTNVGIIGEDGRINLNAVGNKKTSLALANLIVAVGEVGAEEAQQIVTSIANLIGEDEGLTDEGDSDYYEQSSLLSSVAELRMVSGVDGGLYMRLLPYVTVYSKTGGAGDDHRINVNCASTPVLLALAMACNTNVERNVCESLVEKLFDFKQAGNTFEEMEWTALSGQLKDFAELPRDEESVFQAMMTGSMKTSSSAFRGISSSVGEDGVGSEISVEFVCDIESKKFVYWHEIQ